MRDSRVLPLLFVAPALITLLTLFVYPLGYSLLTAFVGKDGAVTTANFFKAFEFYAIDIGFTVVIVGLSTVLIAPSSPTPHNRRTGLSLRKPRASARPMTAKPRGLSRSEAILARNLL